MKVGSIAHFGIHDPEVEQSENNQTSVKPDLRAPQIRTGRAAIFVIPMQQAEELSAWSQSAAKRVFDCLCVLFALPLLLPVLLAIAIAVRLTSSGPMLFLQTRVGCRGRAFTILKFRTMLHDEDARHHPVTTADNQPFTSIGPFLRRWKLDELPQIFNVLAGDMSLVGPRPKMPEHVQTELQCRPGITGAATIAFAREETILDRVPKHSLDDYYHHVVLPAKLQLDAEYMARATFASDLRLILNSMLRRWDTSIADSILEQELVTSDFKTHDPEHEAVAINAMTAEPIALRAGSR